MVYEAEAGSQRWLLKAIRDSAGEIFSQFEGLSGRQGRWRPLPSDWCLTEVAAHLRDADRLRLEQIESVLTGPQDFLPDEALDLLPSEQHYENGDLDDFLGEFADARREVLWTARYLAEEDWFLTAPHRYRGAVSIADIIRDLHRHDLEHLYQCKRLREMLRQS